MERAAPAVPAELIRARWPWLVCAAVLLAACVPGDGPATTSPDGGTVSTTVGTIVSTTTSSPAPGPGGRGPAVINVPIMFDTPVDPDGSFLPPEFPAGLGVLLDAQPDPADNGLYVATEDGRLQGPPRPVATLEHAASATLVVIGQTIGDLAELPVALTLGSTTGADLRVVAPAPDGGIELRPVQLTPESLLDLTGRAFPPAWNDISVDRDTRLTLNDVVVVVDTGRGDVTVTMGPHATIVRPTFVWNRTGGGTVTVVNLPGDGDDFRHELGPGERAVVLPDGAAWHAWPLLPPDGSPRYRPAQPADWHEVPSDLAAALDELAARLTELESGG